jgi:cell division protein FtsA
MSSKSIFAAGLDAGSSYTRCVIVSLQDDRLRFLGAGCVRSRGWARSRIVDQQAVSECILAAVEHAEAMAHTAIETVVTGMGGLTVRGANSRGHWDLGRPREITQKDVNRAMDRAMRVQLQEDRLILQVLPQDFVVDDHPGFHDPRQMLGSTIEANAHLLTASVQEHNNLIGAVNRAHLSVDETIHEAIAACYASVLPEDRQGGVVLVDIGQQSTELVCYFGESAQLATTLKICGDHFSRDLAHALCISLDAAAIVKEEFGSAIASGTAENSMVELPGLENQGREARDAPRKFINEILESRAIELFEMVRSELTRVGMQRAVANGLVIAGGGALLPGVCDAAERVMECPARIGLAQGLKNWPEELHDPAWTTVAGLAMYSARLRSQVDVEKQSVGVLGRILR